MYRSFSELSHYGSYVFQVFAQYEEQNKHVYKIDNNCTKSESVCKDTNNRKSYRGNSKCCNARISLIAVKEAIYVLLGVYPSEVLLESLLSFLPEETRMKRMHTSVQIIDEETFIHFLLLIAPHYKQVLQCKEQSDKLGENTEDNRNNNSWDNTTWMLFNALSTFNSDSNKSKQSGKGYVSLEDLLSASNLLDKFSQCNAEFTDFKSRNHFDSGVSYNNQRHTYTADVIARVFTILDTDQDGKLQYSDVKKWLEL